MNARLLQLGAEVLGWRIENDALATVAMMSCDGFRVQLHDPMLPAYMAEALVATLPVDDYRRRQQYSHYLLVLGGAGTHFAPSPARIAAALVALGRITLDEAREMVG